MIPAEFGIVSTDSVLAPATLTSSSRLECTPHRTTPGFRNEGRQTPTHQVIPPYHDHFGTKHDNPWGYGTRYISTQLIDRSKIGNS